MVYLLMVKKVRKSKIIKVMDKIQLKINQYHGDEDLTGILTKLDPFKKLLNSLPSYDFVPQAALFPDLTSDTINSIYRRLLPTKQSIDVITKVIDRLSEITKQWDSDSILLPFGSTSNGFRLRGSSDLDLTLMIPDRMTIHPYYYHSELLKLLRKKTGEIWTVIDTPRLFILSCDYQYDEFESPLEVEILFNNVTGLVNSDYIRTISCIDSRFHQLGYYLKYFIDRGGFFTKQNKLNSFSVICMLMVYLQDVVQPPVLPRIIYNYDEFTDNT